MITSSQRLGSETEMLLDTTEAKAVTMNPTPQIVVWGRQLVKRLCTCLRSMASSMQVLWVSSLSRLCK